MKYRLVPFLLLFLLAITGCTTSEENEILSELNCSFSMPLVLFATICQAVLVIILYAVNRNNATTSKNTIMGLIIVSLVLVPLNLFLLFNMSSTCFSGYNVGRRLPVFYLVADIIVLVSLFIRLAAHVNNVNKDKPI